ncbi:SEC10/PgrA surface exclusion domain-containing protein [Streptococcus suis]|uniref:SEC10/PgrA surface exclusion domain-containing protein n=1 Tax=Streptococcus suis TaxID=1307 RepID=UPI000CF615BB|nr:SEC10/PgrA surface exclusion domain-containing protein [Streptococcus suis]
MKKSKNLNSQGSIRKLKGFGAVGVLTFGLLAGVSAKAEEVVTATNGDGATEVVADETSTKELLEQSVETTANQVEEAQTAVTQAEEVVTTAQEQLATEQEEKRDADEVAQQARQEYATAQADVTTKTAGLTTAEEAVTTAQKEVETAQEGIQPAEEADVQRQEAIDKAQTAVDFAKLDVTQAEADAKTANDAVVIAEAEVIQAQAEVNQAQAEVDSLFSVKLSDTYGQLLKDFYVADKNKDAVERERIWTELEAESKRLLAESRANNTMDNLKEALNAVESNQRVIIKQGGNGLNEMTMADWIELTQYAQLIVNDIRDQLGIDTKVLVSQGSMGFAKTISDGYLRLNHPIGMGHNIQAIRGGVSAYGQAFAENGTPDVIRYDFQDYTMADLKLRIASTLVDMMLDDARDWQAFGHAIITAGLRGADSSNTTGVQYLGIYGNTVDLGSSILHEYTNGKISDSIKEGLLENPVNPQELKQALTEAQTRLATAQMQVSGAKVNADTAQTALTTAQGILTQAEAELKSALAVPLQTPLANEALKQAKSNLTTAVFNRASADTALTTAKTVRDEKLKALNDANAEVTRQTADIPVALNNVNSAESKLNVAKTALNDALNKHTQAVDAYKLYMNSLVTPETPEVPVTPETPVETPVETPEKPVETPEKPVETPVETPETPVETPETPVETPEKPVTIDVIVGEDGIPVITAKGEPAYHELPTIDISTLGLPTEGVPVEEVPVEEVPSTEVPTTEGKTPVVTVDYAPTFETKGDVQVTPKVVNHSSELKQSTEDSVKILPNTGDTKTNLSYLGLGILGLGALVKSRKKYR